MGLFLIGERYPGADTNTKRALAQADFDSAPVQKLRRAAGLAKLKIDSPGWKPSAWAHVCIPSKKVAIIVLGSNLTAVSKAFRDAWKSYGWQCFCIAKAAVNRATVEDLAQDLVGAVAEVGK